MYKLLYAQCYFVVLLRLTLPLHLLIAVCIVLELEIHSFMRCDKASNLSQAQSKHSKNQIVSRPTFT